MPWTSTGSRPPEGVHRGSRCSPNPAAASAHWSFRCEVGATTTRRRPGLSARSCTAAHRAKVVLPAPGVATARKSGAAGAGGGGGGGGGGGEPVEGALLPRAETDASGHEGERRSCHARRNVPCP